MVAAAIHCPTNLQKRPWVGRGHASSHQGLPEVESIIMLRFGDPIHGNIIILVCMCVITSIVLARVQGGDETAKNAIMPRSSHVWKCLREMRSKQQPLIQHH